MGIGVLVKESQTGQHRAAGLKPQQLLPRYRPISRHHRRHFGHFPGKTRLRPVHRYPGQPRPVRRPVKSQQRLLHDHFSAAAIGRRQVQPLKNAARFPPLVGHGQSRAIRRPHKSRRRPRFQDCRRRRPQIVPFPDIQSPTLPAADPYRPTLPVRGHSRRPKAHGIHQGQGIIRGKGFPQQLDRRPGMPD